MQCPKVVVRDTVGAGDCFVGTFAVLLASYLTNHKCSDLTLTDVEGIVQKCCFASSYSVQFKGGFDKFPASIIEEWGASCVVFTVSSANAVQTQILPLTEALDQIDSQLQSDKRPHSRVQSTARFHYPE